jgi:hypothetical protein
MRASATERPGLSPTRPSNIIAAARKYTPITRDSALFWSLYHAGPRQMRPRSWTGRTCTSVAPVRQR